MTIDILVTAVVVLLTIKEGSHKNLAINTDLIPVQNLAQTFIMTTQNHFPN